MPKLGNKDISKIYKGSTEITKVYKGETEVYSSFQQLLAPIINEVQVGATEYKFAITNNNDVSVTVNYELDTTPPTANQIAVGANTTSSNITLLGLSQMTSYTLYAQSLFSGATSSISEEQFTTTTQNQGVGA